MRLQSGVVGPGNLALMIEDCAPAVEWHIHVRLPRAEPDLARHNIFERHMVGLPLGDGDGVGASGSRGGDFCHPAAVGGCNCRYRHAFAPRGGYGGGRAGSRGSPEGASVSRWITMLSVSSGVRVISACAMNAYAVSRVAARSRI